VQEEKCPVGEMSCYSWGKHENEESQRTNEKGFTNPAELSNKLRIVKECSWVFCLMVATLREERKPTSLYKVW
jgi:hypothetical protein